MTYSYNRGQANRRPSDSYIYQPKSVDLSPYPGVGPTRDPQLQYPDAHLRTATHSLMTGMGLDSFVAQSLVRRLP